MVPLTEHILARLRGPRAVWIILWAGVYLVAAAAASLFGWRWSAAASEPWVAYALMSAGPVNAIALWAAGRLSFLARAAGPSIEGLQRTRAPLFVAMGSPWAPIGLTVLITGIFTFPPLLQSPSAGLGLVVAGSLVSNLGGATFLWVYGTVLVGLDVLGRADLRLRPFEEDLSLGLRPVAALAFAAFWLGVAVVLPLIPAAATGTQPAVFVAAVVSLVTVLFFLSLYRLHLALTAAKRRQLARVEQIHARILTAALADGTPEGFAARAQGLLAAAAVERRAEAIQEWPFDSSILARLFAIATGVLVAVTARLLSGLLL